MGCLPFALQLLLVLLDLGLGTAPRRASGAADTPLDTPLDAPLETPLDTPDMDTDKLDNVARQVLEGLGVPSRTVDMSKANISQDEWTTMTQLYLDRVAARRQAEALESADKPWDTHLDHRKIYTFQARRGSEVVGGRGGRTTSARRTPRTFLKMDLPPDTEVDDAEVRVLVEHPGTLRLYEVWSGGRRLVVSQNVTTAGWTQIDVTASVRRASERPSDRIMFELRCRRCQDAALNVIAEPAHHVRARRAVIANCGKDGQKCCRHSLEVEVALIPGMEYIVQPKRFDLGLCRGRCPPRYHPAHNHSLMQGLLRRLEQRERREFQTGSRVPRPCCAPARLQTLEILFADEDNPTKLKVGELKEMMVVSCACA